MADLYKNKYRTKTTRAPYWDYGWNAAYFITICTQDREHFFGDVADGKMQLSEMGAIANRHWLEIPERFPYAILGAHIIMPNHMHGIIIINKNDDDRDDHDVRDGKNAINRVSTITDITATIVGGTVDITPDRGGVTGEKNPMLWENVSRIIRWYKGRVSFEARKVHADFGWQSRFYDHIIRDERAHHTISNYIRNNPAKWDDDKFYG